jgi:hypothetical protein
MAHESSRYHTNKCRMIIQTKIAILVLTLSAASPLTSSGAPSSFEEKVISSDLALVFKFVETDFESRYEITIERILLFNDGKKVWIGEEINASTENEFKTRHSFEIVEMIRESLLDSGLDSGRCLLLFQGIYPSRDITSNPYIAASLSIFPIINNKIVLTDELVAIDSLERLR